ncbi:MAG: RNA polymerase sigma factor [Bryobacter sp.]|nr:RNA polymerase sigma factor [Bryobacter sp.]
MDATFEPIRVLMETRPSPAAAGSLREQQDAFVQAHLKRIFLIIYRIVGNVDDAQDLAQEAFIKALQRQDQIKDLDKAAHWLSRIATNTALDFLRRNQRASFTNIDELPETLWPSQEQSPEDRLLRDEEQLLLNRGLETLTPRERTALVLRDIEDLEPEEVARHLNCSKATVRSHIANARVKFKKYLERRRTS